MVLQAQAERLCDLSGLFSTYAVFHRPPRFPAWSSSGCLQQLRPTALWIFCFCCLIFVQRCANAECIRMYLYCYCKEGILLPPFHWWH